MSVNKLSFTAVAQSHYSTSDKLLPIFIELNRFKAESYLDVKNSKGYVAIAIQYVTTWKQMLLTWGQIWI